MQIEQIVAAIAETLTDDIDNRSALVALGMVTSGIITDSTAPGERAELVETFCNILRGDAASKMN